MYPLHYEKDTDGGRERERERAEGWRNRKREGEIKKRESNLSVRILGPARGNVGVGLTRSGGVTARAVARLSYTNTTRTHMDGKRCVCGLRTCGLYITRRILIGEKERERESGGMEK